MVSDSEVLRMKYLMVPVLALAILASGCSMLRYKYYGGENASDSGDSSAKIEAGASDDVKQPKPQLQSVEPIVKDEPVQSSKVVRFADIKSWSDDMIDSSVSYMEKGSVVYVEDIAVDPPFKYDSSMLTKSVNERYAASGICQMASADSVKDLRSRIEYRDVAGGDWASLATLARSQNYDYVFYGSTGLENKRLYLTYYLIKVSTGEIVWDSTKFVN